MKYFACFRAGFLLRKTQTWKKSAAKYLVERTVASWILLWSLFLRLAHKSSSKLSSSEKRELEFFYVFGGKWEKGRGAGACYRNRKRRTLRKSISSSTALLNTFWQQKYLKWSSEFLNKCGRSKGLVYENQTWSLFFSSSLAWQDPSFLGWGDGGLLYQLRDMANTLRMPKVKDLWETGSPVHWPNV